RVPPHPAVIPIVATPFVTIGGRAHMEAARDLGDVDVTRHEVVGAMLVRIEVDPRCPREEAYERWLVVHEVAHAWANSGPDLVDEGGADLLAECMVAEMGHHDWLREQPVT